MVKYVFLFPKGILLYRWRAYIGHVQKLKKNNVRKVRDNFSYFCMNHVMWLLLIFYNGGTTWRTTYAFGADVLVDVVKGCEPFRYVAWSCRVCPTTC
jgi:hypothetical protein